MSNTESPAVAPLAGETTVDEKVVFEPIRLGYVCAARLADRITRQIENAVRGRLVVVVDNSLLADLSNLEASLVTLAGVQRDYETLAPAPGAKSAVAAAMALGTVAAGAQAVLGLVSLLRADVAYHGVAVAVDEDAFALALAAALLSARVRSVIVPAFAVLPAKSGAGSLADLLAAVEQARLAAWKAAGPAITRVVELEAAFALATQQGDQQRVDKLAGELSSQRRLLDPIAEPLSRADRRLADLQALWSKADETTGLTVLARLLRAEAIRDMKPVFVHARIVASGGHQRVTRSLWRTMFSGDGLSFAGGAVARWALLGSDGTVLAGGIESSSERSASTGAM